MKRSQPFSNECTGNCKTSVWHVYYKENVKFSSNEGSQFVLNPLYDIDVNLESLKKYPRVI